MALLGDIIDRGTNAARPAAGTEGRLYYQTDGTAGLYRDNGAAWEYCDPAATGGVATDAIWDAAGDLAVGSGANTAAKLAQGANGTFLGVSGGALGYYTPSGGGGGGQQLGSARITSSVTTTSATPVDATGLSVTVTIGSRPVVVRAFGSMLDHSVAGGRCTAYLVDVTGSATVAEGYHTSPGANNGVPMVLMTDPLSPAAGSRTYKVQFDRGATAGTARIFSSATAVASITVEEV